MRVLLAASDKAELQGFDDAFLKLVTGVGAIQAAAAVSKAIAESKPDIVISVGSAGSLGTLSLGSSYSFGKVVSLDQDLTAYRLPLGATLGPRRETVSAFTLDRSSSLVLASSCRFSDSRPSILADASDMEAYGVALAASLYSIPCLAVKVITDIAGEKVSLPDYSKRLRQWRLGLREEVERLLSRA